MGEIHIEELWQKQKYSFPGGMQLKNDGLLRE